MGCSFSGLGALQGALGAGRDVYVNDNRFRVVRALGGADATSGVFLVREIRAEAAAPGGLSKKNGIDPSHISADGTYALKKVPIESNQQLESVRQEIHVSSQFSHPNLLPLLDHAIISVKGAQDGSQKHEAYLLFPVHLDGTLQDAIKAMQAKNEFFSTITILQIFRQICAGLKQMHNFDPPYAHNGVRPDNVLLTHKKNQLHLAILMDFESTQPARKIIQLPAEALQLQEWASVHCSALYRAPELWTCQSNTYIDERTDVWSLGCTLFAMMYGKSPFDYETEDSEGGLQSAVTSAKFKWPSGPDPPYPETLRHFVTWMLQPQPAMRPHIEDILIHVDKLIAKFTS